MDFVSVSEKDGIATVTLNRGKVNALNESMVEEIADCFSELGGEDKISSVIITGKDKFFSFGFDIPEFLSYSKSDFVRYLTKFSDLYTRIFLFPKPVIAALNGHTVAGGCMIATACDYRIMVSDRSKISLNEIAFGSSVFAGSAEMLGFCTGWKNASAILCSGSMYTAPEAKELGLVDMVVSSRDELMQEAVKKASEMGSKERAAFASIKGILRNPIAERMVQREKDSILEFVDIWYSERTWKNIQNIKIN